MSRRERQQRRSRARGRGIRGKLALAVIVVVAVLFIAALAAVGYVVSIAASAPSIDTLKPINQGASSQVFAANGERLGFIQSDELRSPVPWTQIPQSLKDATVAIEDQRFYKHHGVDYEGIVRAAFKNLTSGKTLQGGSTITMQLVRNLYISRERTFQRKIKEAKLAEELENRHDKQWILGTYLNTVSYGTVGGQTAVGIQAAARTFFNKPANKLTLTESALLAGLPQAPSEYNPFQNPNDARARRNQVLADMAKQHRITQAQADDAASSPLRVKLGRYYTTRREGYFFDYVKQKLIERYGVNTVRQGGLKVYTTVDLKLQQEARKAIAGQLNLPGDPASAIVSIDPKTGYIKAMASSSQYGKSKFNLAAQGHRQPGSTFKVMVLMTALRRGVDPNSTSYVSKPLDFVAPGYGPIKVQTYSHSYSGRINLVQATLKSDNTVYQQLDLDLGPKAVRQTAYDMGVTTHLDGYPAEGLGGLTLGVSPLEMANAFATIASGGWRNKPIAITKVVFPDGKSEYLGKPKRVKAFDDGVTAEATDILQKNIQSGTGTKANIGCPAAGKTGTTDQFTDAWFDGFTPYMSTSVWVGYPKQKVPMTSVHGIQVAGGTFPAAIWHDYMTVAKGNRCDDFSKPSTPIKFAPFFGKYATTGTKGDNSFGYGTSGTPIPGADTGAGTGGTPGAQTGQGNGKGGKGKGQGQAPGKNGKTKGYDPSLYESPPQPAPKTKPSPPSPGSGNGNGNGGTGAPGQ